MDLLHRVRGTIRRHALADRGTRVLAALSGGSDSVALVLLLRALDAAGDLRLVSVAHFNHLLREASDDDERFCVRMAESLRLPAIVDRADVAAMARRDRRSIEDAARTARHAFFERARTAADADVVAVGHTKDDQAETFLLRLVRGAGARGLASMHPRRGHIIRPLLDCRRSELRQYLAAAGAPFVEDATNDDVTIPRNRVRAELLPLLERRFNPSVVDVLAAEADLARADWEFQTAAASEWWDRAVRREVHDDRPRWMLSAAALRDAPLAITRFIVRRAMTEAAGRRAVSFSDVERTTDLIRAAGRPFHGPGQLVERVGEDVVLTGRLAGYVGRPRPEAHNLFSYPLSVPGEVALGNSGRTICAEVLESLAAGGVNPRNSVDGPVAVVRLDQCLGGLAVRNRRAGDKFRPPGVRGRKKLQDFFVDRKVRREQRDAVPIVVDESDRIVWVAGYSIAEEFQVTDPAQAVLILRLKAVGGSD